MPAQVAALSRKDLTILDAVIEKWKGWDTWDLVEHLHRVLPEWKDPGKSSKPIALKTLCSVLGLSAADMQNVEEQALLSRA